MSWKASGHVKGMGKAEGLTRSEKLLMFIIADWYNEQTEEAQASVLKLAEQAMMSERHTRRCLRSLEKKGVLNVGISTGRSNVNSYKLPTLKGDTMSPFTKKRGHPDTQKGDIPTPKGGHNEVPLALEAEKKADNNSPSPQPGEGYLPFKYLTRLYPPHRLKNPKALRSAEHQWGKLTPSDQRILLAGLETLAASPGWLKEHGKWVPNPDGFIEKRDMWLQKVSPNHNTEVERIHQEFIEITGQPATLNKLTAELREHISHRYDEALEMTRGQPTLPMDLTRDAMMACVEAHRKKNIITNMEHIFGTTGNFERWVKKAGYAQ